MEWRVCVIQTSIILVLTSFRDTQILQSKKDNRGIYILAGRPRDDRYMEEVIKPITEQMREIRSKVILPPSSISHRRGEYAIVTAGFSLGPGSYVSKAMLNYISLLKVTRSQEMLGFPMKLIIDRWSTTSWKVNHLKDYRVLQIVCY